MARALSVSFQVVQSPRTSNTQTEGKYVVQKIRKTPFLCYSFPFGEADFHHPVGESGENEAESAIFLSWFSVLDSADGALLWDKMDVSTCLSLCF